MLSDRLMYWPRRIALFIRDYVDEFPLVWSLTRMRDCERWGGHYWGEPDYDANMGYGRECSGCGTWESVSKTNGTGSTTIYQNTTGTNSGWWAVDK